MLPKMPPPSGQVGFIYVPPYRIQGASVAGEHTVVQVPELDIVFDIGICPRHVLKSPYIAISHGHMDHVGGLPYWFSQRHFQKLGPGTAICHPKLVDPLEKMMAAWADIERQRTPHEIRGLEPDEDIEIKPDIRLKALEVSHGVPALGYSVIEHRSKLRPEFHGLPQEQLRELKKSGQEITETFRIPLVAYTGDTEFGPYLYRDEFAKAKVVIVECTFFDAEHRKRASIGKHLHVDDIARLLEVWEAEAVVLIHVSRRSHMSEVQQVMRRRNTDDQAHRVLMLMDHRGNRLRYERQTAEVAATGRTIDA